MNKLSSMPEFQGSSKMSDVVLVLGMHRSGTSAVAGALTKLGGAAPAHLLPANFDNPRGFFESVAFMQFHDDLLASAGSSWHDWRLFNPGFYKSPVAADYKQRAKDLFAAEFNGTALAVLKDPRMCRFVPFWLDVLRQMQAAPHIVMPIRSPLDAALSLKQRNGFSLTKGMLLWLRHVLDAEAQSRVEARSIFTWNDFQSDWRRISAKIAADTGLAWPRLSDRASYEIDRFLAKELVHHESDHAELLVHSDVHEWTLRAYEALLELARNPLSNSALDTLDQVRALLDQSSTMFGRILVDYEIGLEDLRGHKDALTSERDLLQVRQSELLAEKATAVAELLARVEQVERALEEAVRDREALSQNLAASVAERDALHEERARIAADLLLRKQELAAALAEFATRDEQVERALDEAVRDREALSQTLAASVAERDALREERAQIAAELLSRQQELAASITELADMRREFGEIARKHAEALTAVELANAERDKISADLVTARTEAAAQKESSDRDAAETRKTINALAEGLGRRDAEIEAANSARGEALHRNEELGRTLQQTKAENAEARQRLAMHKADLAAANSVRIAAERKAHDLKQVLDLTQHKERELQSQTLAALESMRVEKAAVEAVRAELAGNLDQALQEKHGLAARLDHMSAELQRAQQVSAERAAAREAAHAQALAEAQKVHETQIHTSRGQLVDAEAALSHETAKHAHTGVVAKLLSAKLRRRRLARQLIRSGLFDTSWYVTRYPDVERSGLGAAEHYLEIGFCHGYWPNAFFDTRSYLERYEDVLISGMNPLVHYLLHGFREGRDPGPDFDNAYYLETNPDVRANGTNPLAHYLRHGRHEGRLPVRPG
jgi:hypothetical protein